MSLSVPLSRFPARVAAASAVAAMLSIVVSGFLYRRTGLLAITSLLPLLFTALATAIVSYLRFGLARAAAEEAREEASLASRSRPDASLFGDRATESFTAARSREQFDRWFVSALPLLLAAVQFLWAWRLLKQLPWGMTGPTETLLGASFLGAQAFVFFITGRYLAALGRAPEFRMARGPAHAAGAACLGTLLATAGALATALTGDTFWDDLAARILLGLAALMALENVLRFLTGLYSPRRTEALTAAHESAIGGLFIAPGAWAGRLSEALDYQFGFAVSESGFARLMRTALAPLLIAQLILLHLMSCFVFLGPEETGWRERGGRPLPDGAWASGFHLKAPWPFETVRRLPTRRIQSVEVGFRSEPDENKPRVLLWTIPHYAEEDTFVVPSRSGGAGAAVPVNLVTLNVPVEYLITNFFAHAYGFADPEATIRQAAYRAVTREISGTELGALLGPRRAESVERIHRALQADCDHMALGVQIVSIPLPAVHPPTPVADAFQSVVGALEQKEATILAARAHAGALAPRTTGALARIRSEAEAYKTRRAGIAAADALQYTERLKAYTASPEVFRSRLYFGALRDALAGTRKFIVDAPGDRQVLYFNLEDKAFQNLFELTPGPGTDAQEEPAHP